MNTYKIEIFTRTSKGKTNHIDNVFINSEADKDSVAKYYSKKYSPLSVSVSEVEVVDIDTANEDKEVIGVKQINGGSMYSDPTYRIHRKSLPKEVAELIDKLDELEKQVFTAKADVNKELFKYFSSGVNLSSYSSDGITVSGRPNAFALNLRKKDE